LVVVIHGCNDLEKMDLFSESDPFVVVTVDGEQKFKTETKEDDPNPKWNIGFSIPHVGKEIKFSVFDDDSDKKNANDLIGEVSFTLDKLQKLGDKSVHHLTRQGKQLKSTITLSVEHKTGQLGFKTLPNSSKKALIIGINYYTLPPGKGQLGGCVNDVKHMKAFIMKYGHYTENNIRCFTDDPKTDAAHQPTKANILAGLSWLVDGAKAGDSLFFHFSGHGGQIADKDGDEADGMDETVYPMDYQTAGFIIDDQLYEMIVEKLPLGSRLTAVMDCCHSGTGMDLPYERVAKGKEGKTGSGGVEKKVEKKSEGMLEKLAKRAHILGHVFHHTAEIMGFTPKDIHARHDSAADIVLFSGCRDDQTSADASIEGAYSGAMTFALLKTVEKWGLDMSYDDLLEKMREILSGKYSQIPQLSTGRPFDLNTRFGF